VRHNEPIKLLAIEDNPGDMLLLRDMLSLAPDLPVELAHTEWLSAGLAMLGESEIDVVLLDIMLPDSRGFDALSNVLEQAPDVPVIILSSLNDDLMAQKLIRDGAFDYLVKGEVESEQLAETIRRAVQGRRETRE
jgi:DNA-binding NarL/FixJ family response regulator